MARYCARRLPACPSGCQQLRYLRARLGTSVNESPVRRERNKITHPVSPPHRVYLLDDSIINPWSCPTLCFFFQRVGTLLVWYCAPFCYCAPDADAFVAG